MELSKINADVLKSFKDSDFKFEDKAIKSYTELTSRLSVFAVDIGIENPVVFSHNKIALDNKFIPFMSEMKLGITSHLMQSVSSWSVSDHEERYILTGVYSFDFKGVKICVASLFQKGAQNDDEITFAVALDRSAVDTYLEFKKKYEDWLIEKDHDNHFVHVVGSQSIPYSKDLVWDDLFLEDKTKQSLIETVEGFLKNKQFYLDNKIPWKRGVLLLGPPGTGKTSIIKTIMSVYNFKPVTIPSQANLEILQEAFTIAKQQSPALLYIEDLDSMIASGSVDMGSFLNLLDGVSSANGFFVVATANDAKKLKSSLLERPSRFDRKFIIDLPTEKMVVSYLEKWFKKAFTKAQYVALAKRCVSGKLSYAYVKEIYISSMYLALSKDKKYPTYKEVDSVLTQILKDKTTTSGHTINLTDYIK